MSIFGSIMHKLGFGHDDKEVTTEAKNEVVTEATPKEIVDVVKKLTDLATIHSEKLNWEVSIVDLMKLLDLDSSYGHRKDLAKELACPADLMDDSAKMNVWLHKQVMIKLAQNGGNIPSELLK